MSYRVPNPSKRPDRLKCNLCDQYKNQTFYSNKALKDWDLGKKSIRCRTCTPMQIQELQCEGHCGKWKVLSEFSKSQRKAGSAQWCQECVLWKESAEPGVSTAAAPGTELSYEEGYPSGTASSIGNWEGGSRAAASVIGTETTTAGVTSSIVGNGMLEKDYLMVPFHARNSAINSGSAIQSGSSSLPPHLRHLHGRTQPKRETDENSSMTSISNPYQASSTAGPPSSWNMDAGGGRPAARPAVSSTTSNLQEPPRGNFAKAIGRKVGAPVYEARGPAIYAAAPTRPPQVFTSPRPEAEKQYYSDGESGDDM